MSLDRPRTSREISDKKKKAPESGAFWYKILDKNIRRGRGRCDFVDTIPVLREETKINGNRAGPPSPERMVPNNESKPEHYLRLKIPTAFFILPLFPGDQDLPRSYRNSSLRVVPRAVSFSAAPSLVVNAKTARAAHTPIQPGTQKHAKYVRIKGLKKEETGLQKLESIALRERKPKQ